MKNKNYLGNRFFLFSRYLQKYSFLKKYGLEFVYCINVNTNKMFEKLAVLWKWEKPRSNWVKKTFRLALYRKIQTSFNMTWKNHRSRLGSSFCLHVSHKNYFLRFHCFKINSKVRYQKTTYIYGVSVKKTSYLQLFIKKITNMWKKWGTPQNFFLAFIDELEKQLFIKKNFWSGPIKNIRTLIFTMLYFKKKIKKNTWRYHYFTSAHQNLNDMIYSSWDIEHEGLKLLVLGHFLPFDPPKNPKNQNFEKKIAGDIIILHMYTKNHNHRDVEWQWQHFLSFWVISCPFTSLTTWTIKILKRWKKHLDMSSFYTCVPKIMITWCMVPEKSYVMDGQTDGQKRQKKWHIEVGAPPKKIK